MLHLLHLPIHWRHEQHHQQLLQHLLAGFNKTRAPSTKFRCYFVRNCCANHWYLNWLGFSCIFNGFANCFWYFLSFTSTKANTTITVTTTTRAANETTSTFNFCNTVNRNYAFFSSTALSLMPFLVSSLIEFQSVFTSCISQAFYTSVI